MSNATTVSRARLMPIVHEKSSQWLTYQLHVELTKEVVQALDRFKQRKRPPTKHAWTLTNKASLLTFSLVGMRTHYVDDTS